MPQVSLQALVAGVRSGQQLASFPTDTVPALAARPDGAALIYAAKQRSETKPLILMGATLTDLWEFVAGSEADRAQWQQVANRYFPGALTLVLPASDRLPPAMNPTDPTTIGIRIPDSAIARHILTLTGPLATTSANRSGEPALQNMADIEQQFPEVLTLLPSELAAIATVETPQPDASTALNITGSGIPSTVAKWTGSGWQILRQGRIHLDE